MTLQEREATEVARTTRSFVLKAKRLMLRTAVPHDAEAITAPINDRRIADNMVGFRAQVPAAGAHRTIAATQSRR